MFGDTTKTAVKVANLVACVELLCAKLFPRNDRDFGSCVFSSSWTVFGLFKLK